jgi:hypothetical protein
MASPRPGRHARALLACTVAACTLVACALLVAACGGGSKQDKGVSRKQYVAEVDALCRKVTLQSRPVDRRLQALVDASGSFASRLRRAAPLLRRTYDAQSAKLERFKRIESPVADRARIKQLTVAAEAALRDLHDALPAAERGDLPPIIDLVTDASGARGRAERLGADYGLRDDCFTPPITIG